jgi:tetratricopeptide (TPR) repeat protein
LKPSADLHSLIHSLSPNEKGYFKKYCQRSGEASRKYLQLFDAVAAQKEYDEAKLKKKLKDPVLTRNLSSEKNYLFHLILESLIAGQPGSNATEEHRLLLGKARLLAIRLFHDIAIRFVRKVIAFAEENELFSLHLEAIEIEWLLWQYLPKEESRSIDEITQEQKMLLRKSDQLLAMRTLDLKMIEIFQTTGIGRDENVLAKFNSLYEEGEKKRREYDFLTVRAGVHFYNMKAFYYNASGDVGKSVEATEKVMELFRQKPLLQKERLSFYMSALNNVILAYLHTGEYEKAEKGVNELNEVKPETESQENTFFVLKYNTRFDLYTFSRQWQKALELSKELKDEIHLYDSRVDNRFTGHIRFAAFRSCFYTGEYKEALRWLNQIVQKTQGAPFKQELLTIARICELVLHDTLGNDDLLEKMTDTATGFLEKKNALYEFEKTMIGFFKERVSVRNAKQPFEKLINDLSEMENDLLENRVFAYFNFKAWAEASLQKKTVAEYLC